MRVEAPLAILIIALALLWPVAIYGGALGFYDSDSYYNSGMKSVAWLIEKIAPAPPPPAGAAGADAGAPGGAAAAPVTTLRSVPYSILLYLAARPAGFVLPLVPTALLAAWMIWRFLDPLAAGLRAGIGVALAGLTGVAAHVSQLMPDIYAGLLVLAAMIAARGGLARWEAWLLAAVATAAALFHYAHLPLALVLGVALAVGALRAGRVGAAALAVAPALLGAAVNVALSLVIADGPSLAPARYPLLLARALADGPARDYLIGACDVPEGDAPYTICELYEGEAFPSDIHGALWSPDGIVVRSTPEQMVAIVAEEGALLAAVMRTDPAAQAAAFARNAGRQLVLFGFSDIWTVTIGPGPHGIGIELVDAPPPGMEVLEAVQLIAVLASLPVLVWAAWRGGPMRGPAAILALGLVANAAICGGLSAPADRYGARMIWLVVLAALAVRVRTPDREAGRPRGL